MDWLTRWFSQHPLRRPPAWDRAQYTRQVMARVRRLEADRRAPARLPAWLPWPRLALAAATAAAGLLLTIGALRMSSGRLAATGSAAGTYRLAESADADDRWVEDTLLLLEQLDEEIEAADEDLDDHDWLDELKQLDESEFSASS